MAETSFRERAAKMRAVICRVSENMYNIIKRFSYSYHFLYVRFIERDKHRQVQSISDCYPTIKLRPVAELDIFIKL